MKHNSASKRRWDAPPPLRDASSKAIFASIPFMARILKDCVRELAPYSQQEIMKLCQKANIHFANVPVHDQQAAGEILARQTGKQRITLDNLSSASSVEDASVLEGSVHFDLLIELTIPMPDGDHIAVMVNIEIQNDGDNVCRIIKKRNRLLFTINQSAEKQDIQGSQIRKYTESLFNLASCGGG